jgi:hypothetical protein
MRLLENRAREFVNYVKEDSEETKKLVGYVTTDNGVLAKGGKELLPLFLIPMKTKRVWDALVDLFVRRVQEISESDLMVQYGDVNDDFILDWIDAANLTSLAADIRAIHAADGETL